MHWICPLYNLSKCWMFVEVLLSAVFKCPQQWLNMLRRFHKGSCWIMAENLWIRWALCVHELNMLSSPKISQRLLLKHGWEWRIRWALCVHGLNMLSVAVQMHSTSLSHTWMTAKQKIYWAVLSDQFQMWLNKTQHRSTPLNRVFKCAQLDELNILRASLAGDKSSAFARCLRRSIIFSFSEALNHFFLFRKGFSGLLCR